MHVVLLAIAMVVVVVFVSVAAVLVAVLMGVSMAVSMTVLLLRRPCLWDVVEVLVHVGGGRDVVVMVYIAAFMAVFMAVSVFLFVGVAVAVPCRPLLQLLPNALAALLLHLQLLCCCGLQPGLVDLYVHCVSRAACSAVTAHPTAAAVAVGYSEQHMHAEDGIAVVCCVPLPSCRQPAGCTCCHAGHT